jgi:aspartate carbamoyltransferase regulatory subunit
VRRRRRRGAVKAAPAGRPPQRRPAGVGGGRATPGPYYRVAKLRSGTVVDHLEAGTAISCLAALGIPADSIVTLGLHLPSRRFRRKDILKVENRVLSAAELSRIALFGPRATVSIIENYEVVRKIPLELPTILEGVVACPNPSCITHHDPVVPRVRVEEREPVRLRCHYCERRIRRAEIRLIDR